MIERSVPPSREVLDRWLRAAKPVLESEPVYLRGSILIDVLCPGYRVPRDIDYLVDRKFEPEWIAEKVRAIAEVISSEIIFGETEFPGVRVTTTDLLTVDFGFGDPLSTPPVSIEVAGVGSLRAIAAETLFGFKLHGLAEHGPGRWGAKDLADLYMLWTRASLDRALLLPAVKLAFESRGITTEALADFRTREAWGKSSGGQKKWRRFLKDAPAVPDFDHVRAVVRRACDELGI